MEITFGLIPSNQSGLFNENIALPILDGLVIKV